MAYIRAGRCPVCTVEATMSAMVSPVPTSSTVSSRELIPESHQGFPTSCCASPIPSVPGSAAGGGLPRASTTSVAVISWPSAKPRMNVWLGRQTCREWTVPRTRSRLTCDGAARSAVDSFSSRYWPYRTRGKKSSAVTWGSARWAYRRKSSGSEENADMRPAGTFSRYV